MSYQPPQKPVFVPIPDPPPTVPPALRWQRWLILGIAGAVAAAVGLVVLLDPGERVEVSARATQCLLTGGRDPIGVATFAVTNHTGEKRPVRMSYEFRDAAGRLLGSGDESLTLDPGEVYQVEKKTDLADRPVGDLECVAAKVW